MCPVHIRGILGELITPTIDLKQSLDVFITQLTTYAFRVMQTKTMRSCTVSFRDRSEHTFIQNHEAEICVHLTNEG